MARALLAVLASAALVAVAAAQGGSAPQAPPFCKGLECPKYTVLKKVGNDIELRRYEPCEWPRAGQWGPGGGRAAVSAAWEACAVGLAARRRGAARLRGRGRRAGLRGRPRTPLRLTPRPPAPPPHPPHPAAWASIASSSATMDQAMGGSFMKLFNYISGENSDKTKVGLVGVGWGGGTASTGQRGAECG
jgi:hypothetical protein